MNNKKLLIIGFILFWVVFYLLTNLWYSTIERVSFETEINDFKIEKLFINSGVTIVWGEEKKLLIDNLKELNSNKIFVEVVKKDYYLNKEGNSSILTLKGDSKSYEFILFDNTK
jgi:hypothetical protein